MSIARLMQIGAAGAGGRVLETTGYDFDPGVRDDAYPTTHTGTLDIPATSAAAIFVVTRARTSGLATTPSLTVGGDTCTEVHSVSFNNSITRVYYLINPTTGSVSFTSVDNPSVSAGVAVIGLAAAVYPSVSSTVFTPSNTTSTGLQTILSLSAGVGDLVYCVAASSNYVAEATSTNTPNSLFNPVEQARTGSIPTNFVHCSSDVFALPATYTVNFDVTTGYTYADSSVYLVFSGYTTTGSFYAFDTEGTDGGLEVLSVTNSDFGTGDFTYEAWVYPTSLANNYNAVVGHQYTAGGGLFYVRGDGAVTFYDNGIILDVGAGTISEYQWYHVAAVRNSGTLTLYINGTSVGSTAYTNSISDSNLYVGQNQADNEEFQGYIYKPHVLNSAKYTSSFTPSINYGVEATSLILLETDGATATDLEGNSVTNNGANFILTASS